MEHLTDELDAGRFIRILLFEMHHQSEGTILEIGVGGTYDDGVPERRKSISPAACQILLRVLTHQVITLSAMGDADTPAGGSVCIRYG